MNIVLNIVNKKQNLSYPLIFRKIANYYWNRKEIAKNYKSLESDFGFLLEKWCVKNNYTNIIKYLDRYQIIYQAVGQGDIDFLKFLKLNKCELDKAFGLACDSCQYEVTKYLVENGADISSDEVYGLRVACYHGDFKTVKFLLERQSDFEPYIFDEILTHVSKKGFTRILNLIFKYTNITLPNIRKYHHYALINNNLDTARQLLYIDHVPTNDS